MGNGSPLPSGTGDGLPPPNTLSCLSTACQSALSAVVDDANNIIAKCSAINTAKGWVNALLAIIGVLFSAVGALIGWFLKDIGLTILLGILLGTSPATGLAYLILLAIAILLSVVLTLLTAIAAIEIYILVLQKQLGDLQAMFLADVKSVKLSCPPSCWGDLRMPGC